MPWTPNNVKWILGSPEIMGVWSERLNYLEFLIFFLVQKWLSSQIGAKICSFLQNDISKWFPSEICKEYHELLNFIRVKHFFMSCSDFSIIGYRLIRFLLDVINVHKIINQNSHWNKVLWPYQNEVFQKSWVIFYLYITEKTYVIEPAFLNGKLFYLKPSWSSLITRQKQTNKQEVKKP